MDEFVETQDSSWLQNIKTAFAGIVFAPLFCLAGFYMLKYGEIKHANSTIGLKKVEKKVVPEKAGRNGDLIKVDGYIEARATHTDTENGLTRKAIKLRRKVYTYQWIENKKTRKKRKAGGGSTKTTTYTYSKAWRQGIKSSSSFKHPEGHQNPRSPLFQDRIFSQEVIKLDDYTLMTRLANNLRAYRALDIESKMLSRPDDFQFYRDTTRVISSGNDTPSYPITALFSGIGTPDNPEIGDTKIHFSEVKAGDYSVIGMKRDMTLKAMAHKDLKIYNGSEEGAIGWSGKAGYFGMIFSGHPSKELMFEKTHDSIDFWFVLLRFGGLLFVVAGCMIVARPVQLLLSFIPFFGFLWEKLVFKIMQVIGTFAALCISGFYWFKHNQFANLTIYDFYFLVGVLLFLLFVHSLRVEVRMNGEEVYMDEF